MTIEGERWLPVADGWDAHWKETAPSSAHDEVSMELQLGNPALGLLLLRR